MMSEHREPTTSFKHDSVEGVKKYGNGCAGIKYKKETEVKGLGTSLHINRNKNSLLKIKWSKTKHKPVLRTITTCKQNINCVIRKQNINLKVIKHPQEISLINQKPEKY